MGYPCLLYTSLSAEHGTEIQWEFKYKKELITFTPRSHFSINNHLRLQAVSDGLGIAWIAHMSVADALNSGHLVELLPEYAMTYEPLYLYYSSRRGHSNVFKLIVDALKVKADVYKRQGLHSPSTRRAYYDLSPSKIWSLGTQHKNSVYSWVTK